MRSHVFAALAVLALATPAAAQRLPSSVRPDHYGLMVTVDLAHARFDGDEHIQVQLAEPSNRIVVNAAELELNDATVTAAGATQRAKVSLDTADETATLAVQATIPKGPADVHIRYAGKLNGKLRGFYLSQAGNRRYAVTQFESTDARRAFPAFDEPAFKATFAVTLVIDKGDTAISNGAVVSDTPGPGPRQHTMKFATSPKMSSYLVAIAVGDFKCLEGSADGIPIRICATPDKAPLGALALESAEQILKYYDGYYSIRYPFKKLDVVAVPDFAAGAMENTAAIFYRETDLLADRRSASVATRKEIASVLAHEMAHQWFGDLVTMKWWDDLWLNEGFATWMANHPLAAWKPEWNIPVDEAEETQTAMNLDSLKATRPIHTVVERPAEIEETFDAIAYEKGAAVLRMIENYVGAETFRKGVNAYLEAHAYGNATSQDFWSEIARSSGKPVDRILPTFVNQPGVPLVEAAVECANGRTGVMLDEHRFFLEPALLKAETPSEWDVPVCIKAPGQQTAACEVFRGKQTVTLPTSGCAPWVFANAGARGYYRTAYEPSMLRALVPHVQDALTAPERLSLTADEWALVRAGRHSVADYLNLAAAYGQERTGGVLHLVEERLAFVAEYLASGTTRDRLNGWIRQTFRPSLDDIGIAVARADDDNRRELRATLVALLGGWAEDADVIRQAREMVDRALGGGAPLDPTVAEALVEVAAEHGDTALYDALRGAAARATAPDEHYRYLYALTSFRDPKLIDRALDHSLSPDLRSQDAAIYLASFLHNEAARPRAWAFVKTHWARLEPKITISAGDVNLVSGLSAFCDATTRDDIKSFFGSHKLPAAARTLQQTMERINNCIELRGSQRPVLDRWLVSESTRP